MSLQRHRLITKLIVMWKAINNHISLPMPAHVIHKQRVMRQFHPNKFIQLSVCGNVYKFSFVSRTLTDWNNLSNDIIEGTTPNPFLSMRSQRLIATYVSFSCMSYQVILPWLIYLSRIIQLLFIVIFIYLIGCDYSADQFTCIRKLFLIKTIDLVYHLLMSRWCQFVPIPTISKAKDKAEGCGPGCPLI